MFYSNPEGFSAQGCRQACFSKQREESSTETGPAAYLIFDILIPTVLTCHSSAIAEVLHVENASLTLDQLPFVYAFEAEI
ncbi:unnamed protein product [Citrullus colocynthis]|uniref:Uncharacterized protein n=1 Tax=Citrullus colocynthis TaxID=252529 RepID=A0ABP0Y3X8_9ROSI